MSFVEPLLKEPDTEADVPKETRLNVRLSPEARQSLEWIAANRDVSAVEAVRRAIGTEKFFLDLANQKAKVFVQLPGERNLKEVVFVK